MPWDGTTGQCDWTSSPITLHAEEGFRYAAVAWLKNASPCGRREVWMLRIGERSCDAPYSGG
jgi:hypothetical protein